MGGQQASTASSSAAAVETAEVGRAQPAGEAPMSDSQFCARLQKLNETTTGTPAPSSVPMTTLLGQMTPVASSVSSDPESVNLFRFPMLQAGEIDMLIELTEMAQWGVGACLAWRLGGEQRFEAQLRPGPAELYFLFSRQQ